MVYAGSDLDRGATKLPKTIAIPTASEIASGGAEESGNNTTTTPLASSATFTGTWEQNNFSDVMVSVKTDAPGTLYFDFSPDGTNADSTFPPDGFQVTAGVNEFHTAVKGPRYFRVRFVNDTTAQTYLRLTTYFGDFKQGNLPLNATLAADADARVYRTLDEIAISSGLVADNYVITKQGFNPDVDAAEDIWDGGGDYTGFPTTAAETIQVVSSSANDASAGTGARTVRLFYLNASYEMFDSSGNFLYVDVTLNGTTPVSSGVTGMRVWYAQVLTSGSGMTNAGDISVRWATTTSVVFCKILAGYSAAQILALTIPEGYVGTLQRYAASMLDNTSNNARMAFKRRNFGSNTWIIEQQFAISTNGGQSRRLWGGRRFGAKTDIVMRCSAINNANGIITGSYEMRLQKV